MKSDVKAIMKPCNNHNFSSPHCFRISYLTREVIYAYTSITSCLKIHYFRSELIWDFMQRTMVVKYQCFRTT